MKYLYDQSHYEDLYDRATVSRCRWIEDFHTRYDPKQKPKTKEEKAMLDAAQKMALHYDLLFTTGERYLERDTTIREWVERDTNRQEMYDNAEAPGGVLCPTCGTRMDATFKMLYDLDKEKDERVLFMYDCPEGCMPRRSFFQDGEEWVAQHKSCKECGGEIKVEDKSTKKKSIITSTCTECGLVDVSEHEFETEKDDEKFEEDRKRFCLSQEKGQEYIETKQWFKDVEVLMDELKEREEKKDEYDAVKKLSKLTVSQLEKKLAEAMSKDGYSRLTFDKPEIGTDVRIGFTVNDDSSEVDEYTSRNKLKKLISKTLEDTNWRLMTEGISYRLGILTGRLRGYESEADLLKLVSSGRK